MIFENCIEKISTVGKKVKQARYLITGLLPVIDQGQKFISGYTNDANVRIIVDSPVIVFGDHTRIIKFVNFDFAPGADGIKVFKPLPFYDPKYFAYILQAVKLPDKGYSRHYQYLEKSEIPICTLPEQKRIVAKIESLFSRLDSAKDSLARVRQEIKRYRQSVLKSAFEGKLIPGINFRKVTFADVIKKDVGGGTPSKNNQAYWRGDIPWASVKDMNADKYLISTIDTINQKAVNNSSTNVIPAGNIIVCTRISVGKILINKIAVAINQDLRAFFLKEDINIDYFFYYYGTVKFKTSGTTVKGIRKVDLLQYPFPLCSLREQSEIIRAIESRFDRAKVLEDTVEQGLEKIERLKQSILKKAFEGKLVEPDPNDEPVEVLLERIKKEKAKLK
jgi:type I restriction enzyme S subunit